MAEWSKALRLGRSLFGGVGSNPTGCNSLFYFYLFIYLLYTAGVA